MPLLISLDEPNYVHMKDRVDIILILGHLPFGQTYYQ